MKNKFIKLVSSLLILSFLVAAFSVFSFAESTEGEEVIKDQLENLSVFINRDYSDGWEADNGFNGTYKTNGNSIAIDYEIDITGKYNYFTRFEALTTSDALASISLGALSVTHPLVKTTPGTVVEFSVKADDLAYLGNILYMKTSVNKTDIKLLDINKDGNLIVFPEYVVQKKSIDLGKLGNEWINIAFIFDWTRDGLAGTVKLGYGYQNGYNYGDIPFDIPYPISGDVGMSQLNFVIPAGSARSAANATESLGMGYCIDNLKFYQGVRQILELDPTDYGKYMDTGLEKTVNILEDSTEKTKDQILAETLAMKLGVNYALIKNVRHPLINNAENETYKSTYGAPVLDGDNVLVPLELIIDYIGYPRHLHKDNMSYDITTGSSTTYITVGRDTATVNGQRVNLSYKPGYIKNAVGESYLVVALADIPVMFPGWLVFYDDMGLIIVYEDATPENAEDNVPILNRNDNFDAMLNMMKKFVFDTVTDTDIEKGYVMNGEAVYEDVKENTEDFAHPYLIADADTFEKLAAKYALAEGSEGYDKALKSYIQIIVDKADSIYVSYSERDGSGNYLDIKTSSIPRQPGTSDGYNTNGDMSELLEHAEVLPILAFAFHMTGNENYARLAYDISESMAVFEHWGPGYAAHFAVIASNYALAYDWLYNEYKSLDLDTDVLARAIFELAVHDGYISSAGKGCEHGRDLGDLSVYNTSKDSINAIGTSGMIIAALSILDYISGEGAPENAAAETLYLIGNNIQTFSKYGLDIYAPDGSYIESPTYWEAATGSFFRMNMALESAAGNDYGFLDAWGIHKSCYYAIHIENSDGYIWNYHDSPEYTKLNTDMFFYAAACFADENLISVRYKQLEANRDVSIYDLFFYPEGTVAAPKLELDYYMEAIDGFVTRSDWNSGSIYAGLMGGSNAATNGQLDSGNFIYQNKGVSWITDLGGENPYIAGINDPATRYKFYRNSAEGQNVIVKIGDDKRIPYGQRTEFGGIITKTFGNEFGSLAILDNTEVYRNNTAGTKGGSEISYAKRGVLLTNDRSTVVLQDEFAFLYNGNITWVLHTKANLLLDDTGRAAYMTASGSDGKTYTLRASIVSKNPNYKFEIESASKSLLGASSSTTDKAEYSRTAYKRLVVKVTDVTLFEMAVVFEIVDNTKDKSPVSYTWSHMNNWEPSTFDADSIEQGSNIRTEPAKEEIIDYASTAVNYLRRNAVYTKTLDDLYRTLTNIGFLLKVYPESSITESAQVLALADYKDSVEKYDKFRNYINGIADSADKLAFALTGIKTEADAEDAAE